MFTKLFKPYAPKFLTKSFSIKSINTHIVNVQLNNKIVSYVLYG